MSNYFITFETPLEFTAKVNNDWHYRYISSRSSLHKFVDSITGPFGSMKGLKGGKCLITHAAYFSDYRNGTSAQYIYIKDTVAGTGFWYSLNIFFVYDSTLWRIVRAQIREEVLKIEDTIKDKKTKYLFL